MSPDSHDAPKGWRKLRAGEKLRKGDKVYLGEWRTLGYWFGSKINAAGDPFSSKGFHEGYYIRKITRAKKPSKK